MIYDTWYWQPYTLQPRHSNCLRDKTCKLFGRFGMFARDRDVDLSLALIL